MNRSSAELGNGGQNPSVEWKPLIISNSKGGSESHAHFPKFQIWISFFSIQFSTTSSKWHEITLLRNFIGIWRYLKNFVEAAEIASGFQQILLTSGEKAGPSRWLSVPGPFETPACAWHEALPITDSLQFVWYVVSRLERRRTLPSSADQLTRRRDLPNRLKRRTFRNGITESEFRIVLFWRGSLSKPRIAQTSNFKIVRWQFCEVSTSFRSISTKCLQKTFCVTTGA